MQVFMKSEGWYELIMNDGVYILVSSVNDRKLSSHTSK